MEIDELKNIAKQKKAPDMKSLNLNSSSLSIDDLIIQIKRIDAADKKQIIGGIIFISILTILFYFVGTLESLGLVFLVLNGFLLLFIRYFQFIKIDYSAPSLSFLKDAEDRYNFWGKRRIKLLIFYWSSVTLIFVISKIVSNQDKLVNSIFPVILIILIVLSVSLIAGKA